MEIKVKDFLKLINGSDRLKIVKGGKVLFIDWAETVQEEYMEEAINKFRAIPEIKHKEWRKRGLMAPMQPDETPDYKFSDLEMKLYYTIYI